jgi:hypothetical protein
MSQQDRLQNKLEKAVAKLPKDQQIAIGMGFYQFDDAFAEQMEGYLGFDNEDEADCIRVIITAENIKNWIKKF